MDATGQRQGEHAGQGLGEDGDSLARVAEDILWLVVGVGFLMEFLDRGHLLTGLGHFDAITGQDRHAVDAEDGWVKAEDESTPSAGEFVQIQGGAVEEVQ